MRRLKNSAISGLRRSVTLAARTTRPSRVGDDRTHNEEITDRQESFSWHARHVYRPHQSYTYDPTSWNRKASEAAKKLTMHLDILDRLKNLREREQTRETNLAAISGLQQRIGAKDEEKETGEAAAAEDIFREMAGEAAGAESVASETLGKGRLQSLLDNLESSHAALASCLQNTRGKLVLYERRAVEYTDALEAAYNVLRTTSVLDGTISLLSAACLWHHVLRGVSLLAWRIVGPSGLEEAEASIASAINASLLSALANEDFMSKHLPPPHAERDVEALGVLLHPFTEKHRAKKVGSLDPIPRLVRAAEGAIRARLTATDEHDMIPISVHHCAAASQNVLRLMERGTAVGADRLLRVVVDASLAAVRPMLQDAKDVIAAKDPITPLEQQLGKRKGRAVATTRPTGLIRKPVVSSEEVREAILVAANVGCAVMASEGESEASEWTQLAASACVLQQLVLELLEHTPNYHLPPSAILRFLSSPFLARAFADSLPHQQAKGRAGDARCRGGALLSSAWLLASRMLSRLELLSTQELLSLLHIACAQLPIHLDGPAAVQQQQQPNDWARQRGILVQRVMRQLTAPFDMMTTGQIVAALGDGHYDGRVDIRLWRGLAISGCKLLLGSAKSLDPRLVDQLIGLRARCWREGASVAQQQATHRRFADSNKKYLEPISDDDATIVAELLAATVCRGGRSSDVSASSLLCGQEEAWAEVKALDFGADVEQLLHALYEYADSNRPKKATAESRWE